MAAQPETRNVLSVTTKQPITGSHIGALLIDTGKIIAEDAERIVRHARDHGLRFGDAAVQLGLVSRDEIDRVVARQFDYPYLVAGESAVSPEVVAAYKPFDPQVEHLRALRSQLLLRWLADGAKTNRLAIVSVDRADGRSYLAANLAVVFSQLGEHTLLVDADLRNARQHEIFGLPNGAGLSTILAGRAGLELIQRIPAFVALSVLTAGPLPPNPQELKNRANFQRLLDEVSEQYDVILLDTPAAALGADAYAIAARAAGALVMTRLNSTRTRQLKALIDDLQGGGATVIGSVVNER
jgi:chain length determinant protein tyrosine kinase EpsG